MRQHRGAIKRKPTTVKETDLRNELLQASDEEARELIQDLLRRSVRSGLI